MKPDWKDARNCYYPKCDEACVAKGLCDSHYRRLKRYGWTDKFFVDPMHGERHSAEYRVWCHIKGRCNNPADKAFAHYGGRGITICKSWDRSFSKFLEDMGRRPSAKHQIDRINNDMGYQPGNCRWALPSINNRNRRSTKLTEAAVADLRAGRVRVPDVCEQFGVTMQHAHRVLDGTRWRDSLESRP